MANWVVFGKHLEGQFGTTAGRRVDFVTDDLRCSLHTVSYVPNQDTDDFFNDATNEVSGTGYTAGGVALAGKSVSYDAGTNELRFDFDDLVWGPGATISGIRVAVIYKKIGGASSADPVIAYHLDTADRAVSNGTFTLDVDGTIGGWKLTPASS
jgi:hypothetical protein